MRVAMLIFSAVMASISFVLGIIGTVVFVQHPDPGLIVPTGVFYICAVVMAVVFIEFLRERGNRR